MKPKPPLWQITLQPTHTHLPAVVSVRKALKVLWRSFGLRAITVIEQTTEPVKEDDRGTA